LIAWLRERGVVTRCLQAEPVDADEMAPFDSFAQGLDLVVAVGGDGTLLRAAQLAARADVPVLGVKVGRLGFLTEVEPGEAPDLLAQVLEGKILIEERMAVEAVPVRAPWSEPQWALNEVIVEKRARHRLITIRAQVDGEYVTTFSSDGVIVATPTGSTAYSFSARGPIVSPKLECLLLTPVSPHMVFDRSLVLAPEEVLTLEVLGEEPGLVSADGRPGLELPVGARVRIQRAPRAARLVRREGSPSFLSLLREKFSLPGEAPHGGTLRHASREVPDAGDAERIGGGGEDLRGGR
jgi:NAD+ kinase